MPSRASGKSKPREKYHLAAHLLSNGRKHLRKTDFYFISPRKTDFYFIGPKFGTEGRLMQLEGVHSELLSVCTSLHSGVCPMELSMDLLALPG